MDNAITVGWRRGRFPAGVFLTTSIQMYCCQIVKLLRRAFDYLMTGQLGSDI